MRIIAGIARNSLLSVPKTGEVRPTAVRARKALFDSLGPWDGLSVVDLFAGSGALGLEAASRGAAQVTFVESNPEHVRLIERNIGILERAESTAHFEILKRDVFALNALSPTPDIIFADPPYPDSPVFLERLLAMPMMQTLPDGVRLVWEIPDTAPELKAFEDTTFWHVKTVRNYGSVWFLVLISRKI